MRYFKVHIVIFFLAVLAFGTAASTAMAHCGHDSVVAGGSASMDMLDKDEVACENHGHGSASVVDSISGESSDHGATPVPCDECSGVPCQSKIQLPEGDELIICIDADTLHSHGAVQFKNIFLSIIPDPPNSIS